MKQHAEITYEEIEENKDYENIINKVIDKCFENEHLDRLNLYISINLTVPDVIHVINKKYRDVDRATDVLSFPMFEKNEIDAMVKEALENNDDKDNNNELESDFDFLLFHQFHFFQTLEMKEHQSLYLFVYNHYLLF